MKKRPSKAQLRRELRQKTQEYLRDGGEIQQVPPGASGRDTPQSTFNPQTTVLEPKADRTPIPEVLAAIDARRKKKQKDVTKPTTKPKQTIIYDDFGEPLRIIKDEE